MVADVDGDDGVRRGGARDSAAKTAAAATPPAAVVGRAACLLGPPDRPALRDVGALVGGVGRARQARLRARERRARRRRGRGTVDRVEPPELRAGRRRSGRSACTASMPVWLANEAPITSSRSDSFISQLATGVPLRPSTPRASGWSSGIRPLALKVVSTGAPSRSASAMTSSRAPRAPCRRSSPAARRRAMQLDRPVERRRRAARSRRSASGPAGAPAGASRRRAVCTSSGRTRCATPRRRAPRA